MKKSIFNLKTIIIILAASNLSLVSSQDIISTIILNTVFSQIKLPGFRLIDKYPVLCEMSNHIYKRNIGFLYRQMSKDDFLGGYVHIGWNPYPSEISIGGEYASESFQLTVTGYERLPFFDIKGFYENTDWGGSIRVSRYNWSRINPFLIGAITKVQQLIGGNYFVVDSLKTRLGVGLIIKFPYITLEPYWTVDWDEKSPYFPSSGYSMSIIYNRKGTSYPVSSLQSRMKETSQWYRPSYFTRDVSLY